MKKNPLIIAPLPNHLTADHPATASLTKLAAEWMTTGDFWSVESCLETMSKMPGYFSAAAMLQDHGPWVGWYLASFQASDCELLYIYASENSRGIGIGGLLIDHLITRATQEPGIESIFLEVRASNKQAISLYESRNFKNLTRRKRYYNNGDDALVYQRTIIHA